MASNAGSSTSSTLQGVSVNNSNVGSINVEHCNIIQSRTDNVSSKDQGRVRGRVVKGQKLQVPSNLSDADREQKKQKFIRSVGAHSSQLAGQKSDTIKKAKLSDLDFEVNPVLKEVDFYAGKIENYQQYRKEDFFKTILDTRLKDQMLDLNSLENSLYDDKDRHISLAGSAGSGKSTIIKRLVRNIRRKDKFELVYFVTISSISDCHEVSLPELLFDNPSLHDCRDLGYDWLINNQQKAIFIFDGLDQSTWPFLQSSKSSSMGYYDASDTATVMYNLLSGKLFPDLTIVTTSREHVLTHFEGDLRPQRVIQLAGLVLKDRKRLFQALVGDVDGQMWTKMESHSPSIVHFSAIPLISVYNAIAHKHDPNNIPKTMSALLGKILQYFIRSKHAVKREENIKVMEKLKLFSYEMTKAKKVIFSENDLKLKKSQVSDLIIQVPDCEFPNTHLIEGETKLFFTHQCIQEILAALYICEMDTEDFTKEVEERLHDDHWSVVRRFVCGYLLNQETRNAFSKLAKHQTDSDELQNKQNNLKKSLVGELQRENRHNKLELFASLSECENLEFVRSHIKDIEFVSQVIGANGMHALSSVLIGCKKVRKLELYSCHLTAEHLGILSRNLKSADVKMKNLNISRNQLGDATGGLLGEIVKENEVEELEMRGCDITTETLRRFQESSRDSKIRKLKISGNELDDAGGLLGEIVKEYGVDELVMENCGITAETLRRFQESSRGSKIRKLNINENKLGDAGGLLGEIVKENGVDELDMGDCGITAGTLRRFQESSKRSKLRKLDLSRNPLDDDDGFQLLVELLEQGTVKELVAWGCKVTAEQKSTLEETAARCGARVCFTFDWRWLCP